MRLYPRKKGRRYGLTLTKAAKKRNYPPGIHGVKKFRRLSTFGLQLAEKQKAKILYNISEKQFRNYFDKAVKKQGDTSDNLLNLLESRLDNVIYRLGLAVNRVQARQLVSHGHFYVNGKKVNIPSYQVKVGDEITIREKSEKSKYFQEVLQNLKPDEVADWLNWDTEAKKGKVIKNPVDESLKKSIDTKMIIEFYSR